MKKMVSLLCGLVLLGWGVGNHAHADDAIVLNFETGLGSQSVQQVRTLQAWSASVEDFKGLRLRTNGKSTALLARRMGATVMTVPGPDIFMNLQKKIVEAAVAAWEGHRGFGLTNVCGFFTEGDFLPPIYFYLVINENKWNSLPPDLQKVLEDAGGARFAALGGETEADIAEEMHKSVREDGKVVLSFTGPEREKIDKVCAEVREEELSRIEKEGVPDARRYVADFLELMKHYEAQ